MKPNRTKGEAPTGSVDAVLDDEDADFVDEREIRRNQVRWIGQALANKLVETVDRENEPGIVKVRIGAIPTVLTIEMVPSFDGRFSTVQDHGIRTPMQAATYYIREDLYAYPGQALHHALKAYCFWYGLALRKGYSPSPHWWVSIAR